MPSIRTALAALLLTAGCIAGQHAWADTLLTLNGVQDTNGDIYAGSFELLSAKSGSIGKVAITITGSSLPDGGLIFSGSPDDFYCTFCNPTNEYDEFRLVATDANYELYFDIADPLNLNGTNRLIPDTGQSNNYSDLDHSNGETVAAVGIVQGSLDAKTVPDPPPLALFGAGLICLVGFAALRRSRRTAASC